MKKKAEPRFVYCFQPGLGPTPPFLAELIDETPHKATLKIGRKTVIAHRAACSTTPYTKADLPVAPAEKKAASESGFF